MSSWLAGAEEATMEMEGKYNFLYHLSLHLGFSYLLVQKEFESKVLFAKILI